MLIATGSCCCVGTFNYLFAGTYASSRLYAIDPSTGSYSIISEGTMTNVRAISCSPLTNRIYIVGGTNEVYCLENSGMLVWTKTLGSSQLRDICVSNTDHLYVASEGGTLYKLDASDGTEIVTSGTASEGWPYTPGNGIEFHCVCVNASGNVYAGGGNPLGAASHRVVSLDSSGTLRWSKSLTGLGFPAYPDETIHSMAINALDTLLALTIGTTVFTNAWKILTASTGVSSSAFNPMKGPVGDACDYGPSHDVFWGGSGSPVGGKWALKNTGFRWSSGTGNPGTTGIQGCVALRNSTVVFVHDVKTSGNVGQNVFAVNGSSSSGDTNLWTTNIAEDGLIYCVEAQEGRIGAFGV